MVGRYFKHYRKESNVKCTAIESTTSISRSYIANFENEKKNMPDDTIELILTKGFGISTTKARVLINTWRILDRLDSVPQEEKKLLLDNLKTLYVM